MASMKFRDWKMQWKIISIFVITALIFIAGMTGYYLPATGEALMEEKRIATRNVVEVASSIAKHFHEQASEGVLSGEDAKTAAAETIRDLLFNGDEYFWINDLDNIMIMHPTTPSLEGKDVSGLKDKKGNFFLRDMTTLARDKGEGFYTYYWQKQNSEIPLPKVSFVMQFKPWGWIIGSGIFVDDVEAQVTAFRYHVLLPTLIAVILLIGVVLLIVRSITRPLHKGVAFAKEVADGNLDTNLDVRQQDEVGVLAESMRIMVSNLKEKIAEANKATEEAAQEAERARIAMGEAEEAKKQAERAKSEGMNAAAEQISGIVERVTSAAEELSAQVEQSSRGSELQRERAGETATAMEEMNATVLEVAKNASSAAENANNAKEQAEEGAEVVKQVVDAINKVQDQATVLKDNMTVLGSQADGIGQIMNVISDIADQTNLLALNAAIEAARAGDAGRGFAVVADEVRKLAEKTMAATKEVGNSIQAIQDGTRKNIAETDKAVEVVGESTGLAAKAGGMLHEILMLSETNADQVRSIATGAEEQSAASEEINRGTEEINRISSETSEAMNQSAKAVSELAQLAQEMQRLVEEMRQA